MARSTDPPPPRSALLAGATGLVGQALLGLLLESPQYAQVHALLRRPAPWPPHPRLTLHQVDFDHLPRLPAVDDVFIALGTTIKAAGSEAAFRRVDFDAVVNTARAARGAGAVRLLVVSALGADAASRVFYNRVKGEMQQAVIALGYPTVVIAQPSLLLGDRGGLGQPGRFGEALAQRVLAPVLPLLPAGVRPIRADVVARALLKTALHAGPGIVLLSSREMQAIGRTGPRG
jgi:uncharacterized protein YbjT (DUF2867 family)